MNARTHDEKRVLISEIRSCQEDIISQLRKLESEQKAAVAKFAEYEQQARTFKDELQALA